MTASARDLLAAAIREAGMRPTYIGWPADDYGSDQLADWLLNESASGPALLASIGEVEAVRKAAGQLRVSADSIRAALKLLPKPGAWDEGIAMVAAQVMADVLDALAAPAAEAQGR